MVAPNTTFQVNKQQQEALEKYCKEILIANNPETETFQLRGRLLEMDFSYMRENKWNAEHVKAKRANAYGDKNRVQDITVPVTMPQTEAAVSYLHNVFLTGNPIFGVVSDEANIDQALQMDALMEEHGTHGGWVRQLNMFFRDAVKYNLAPIEVAWKDETVYTVETDPLINLSKKNATRPKEVIWSGNSLKRLDPYNTIWDKRVPPAEVHIHGEYAGYVESMSRVRFKQFLQDLGDRKIISATTKALESKIEQGANYFTHYIPQINPDAFVASELPSHEFDWAAWAREDVARKIKYQNNYEVTTLYARIIPSDFGINVPGQNQPQIWKLIFVNGQVLIYAERQTNAHNWLPILVAQAIEDGLSYQTKSFLENVKPLQDIASSIINASMHARRRAVYDRIIYDPSMINERDINSTNPIARIPMRPAGYGKPAANAIHAFPFRDDQTAVAMQEVNMIMSFAEMTNGVNRSQQGLFTKGNKTRHEYQDVMMHSNARNQTMAAFIESQVFVPIKEMLKLNILQYASDQQVYSREQRRVVEVKPMELRQQSLVFKISDGILPTDKLIDSETMQVALQTIPASPEMMQEFDLVGMFIYYLKAHGARNIEDFRYTPEEKQQRFQQQLAQAQQLQSVQQQTAAQAAQPGAPAA